MNTLRSFARWVCFVLATSAAVSWVTLSTLQATFFNKDAVTSWLSDSGVYKNAFNVLVSTSTSGGDAQSVAIDSETVQSALQQTFPAEYLEQQTETVVDSTYNWLRSTSPDISFSLPVHEKQDELKANLAKALEPRVAAFPPCSPTVQATGPCVPAGATAAQVASQIADQVVTENNLLAQPLTEQSFGDTVKDAPPAQVNILRNIATWLPLVTILLPLAIVVFGGLGVLLTPEKLFGAQLLGRKVFFSVILPAVLGLGLWFLASSVQLGSLSPAGTEAAAVGQLLNPFLQQALPSIGLTMALYAGAVALLSLGLWLLAKRLRQARHLETLTAAASPTTITNPATPPPVVSPENPSPSGQRKPPQKPTI